MLENVERFPIVNNFFAASQLPNWIIIAGCLIGVTLGGMVLVLGRWVKFRDTSERPDKTIILKRKRKR